MYKVEIITEYNTIHLEVEDVNTPEMKEIFSQPYIKEVNIEKEKVLTRKKEPDLPKKK